MTEEKLTKLIQEAYLKGYDDGLNDAMKIIEGIVVEHHKDKKKKEALVKCLFYLLL